MGVVPKEILSGLPSSKPRGQSFKVLVCGVKINFHSQMSQWTINILLTADFC